MTTFVGVPHNLICQYTAQVVLHDASMSVQILPLAQSQIVFPIV